jgi:hypothetical protein
MYVFDTYIFALGIQPPQGVKRKLKNDSLNQVSIKKITPSNI